MKGSDYFNKRTYLKLCIIINKRRHTINNTTQILKNLALAGSLLLTSVSFAGTVKLESPKFDKICKVQVTTGNNTDNKLVNTYTNVNKGFSVSGEDRLCYRRSAQPADCDSNYTEWTCNSRKGSGTSVLKLT